MTEDKIQLLHAMLATMAVEIGKTVTDGIGEQQRISVSYEGLVKAKFSERHLQQLLAVAVDELAVRILHDRVGDPPPQGL